MFDKIIKRIFYVYLFLVGVFGCYYNPDLATDVIPDPDVDNGLPPDDLPDPVPELPALTVSFAANNSQVLEDSQSHPIVVKFSRSTDQVVAVGYSVFAETAVQGKDFELASERVSIPVGSTEFVITAVLMAEDFYENDETFSIKIDKIAGVDVGEIVEHSVTILNDDIPKERDMFTLEQLFSGDQQLKVVCDRMVNQGVKNKVTQAFCGQNIPNITGLKDLQNVLGLSFNEANATMGNPDFVLAGRSTSLAMRSTNAINPRVILFSSNNRFKKKSVASSNSCSSSASVSNSSGSASASSSCSVSGPAGSCSSSSFASSSGSSSASSSCSVSGAVEEISDSFSNRAQEEGFVLMGFVRGEQFVEIIAGHFDSENPNDPKNNKDLQFYLLNFQQACNETGTCSNKDLLTEAVEKNFVSWTLYHEEDLKNTLVDCRQCHQSGGPNAQKTLLMQELNDPWTGFMRNDRAGGQALLEDYFSAHDANEEYGGIPGSLVAQSDPARLESFLLAMGFGNGFNRNSTQGRFDSLTIETEVSESNPAQPADNTIAGVSANWLALYDRNVRGEIIQVPYHDVKVSDPVKLGQMAASYKAFIAGEIVDLPDIREIFKEDEIRDIGFKVKANLDGLGILTQACTQCHNDVLDQDISRANFNVNLNQMSVEALMLAQERINLPYDHLHAMPPARFRTLDNSERKILTEYLQTVVNQKQTIVSQ